MNKSEQLLETWCTQSGWVCERIPEEAERTPDYRINLSGIKIYAEVKEIIANEEEIKVLQQLSEGRLTDVYGEEPGRTIREKIRDSYWQIKRFAKSENCPGILVLYNNSGMMGLGRIDHYHVLTGMFGLQTLPIAIPKDPHIQPIYGPDYLGPKKSVTPDQNRYLSGIMTLYEHYEKGLMTFFYHNPHAAYPINTAILNVDNCLQYKINFVGVNWELAQ